MGKRKWAILGAGILAVAAAAVLLPGRAVQTGSWGLSFPQPGQPPRGNATAEQLRQLDAAFLGNTEEKVLYLTFDAGYENGYTAKILDTLKKHQVPAAFFLVGNYLERNPDLTRRMVAEGHTVANHTMHHRDMSAITDPEVFARELEALEELYRQITGGEMAKFYRPPQGIYSRENLKQAQALGYRTVFWSLAYADWNNDAQPDPAASLEKLLDRTHNGAVILLHSTSATNAEILDELLKRWKQLGYCFGTLEELFPAETQ